MNLEGTRFESNLKALMYVNDMNIKDLAKELDIPYSTFYYQFTHSSAMSDETIKKIADCLDVSVDSLLHDIHGVSPKTDNEPSLDEAIGLRKADDLTITIPFVNQKLSAGSGEFYLSDEDIEVKTINISAFMARGIDKNTLLAAEVRGDSMVNEKIYSGDIVIFSRGLIRQEGIYVINYAGDVMVKKLAFDALNNTVDIISGNENYPTRTVEVDNVVILGKVIGWIHRIEI